MNFKGNIWRYYVFSAISFTPFALPVFTLFWQENGMDMFDIYLLQGIFAVLVVFLEVPTGMIADRLGKRTSLIYSALFLFAGNVVYSLGYSFMSFLLAELLLALGLSLLSGADSAMLYDTLKKMARENEYKFIEGRTRAIQMASFAFCNLIGGFAGSYSYRYPLILSCIGPFFAFFIALGFVEVNKEHIVTSFKEGLISYKKLLFSSLKFIRKHKLVQWNILFFALLTGSSTWLLWIYQPYMQLTGLPVVYFGLAFALFNFFAAFSSGFSHKLENYLGHFKTSLLLMLLQLLPLILMSSLLIPFSFLFILGHQAVRGISRPVLSDSILKYTFADKRATVLSIGSLAGRLFFSVTSPFIGYIAKGEGIITNIVTQAVILTFIFIIMIFSYLKIPKKYFEVKDAVFDKQ